MKKFRIWDNERGRFVENNDDYEYSIALFGSAFEFDIDDYGRESEMQGAIVQQFTGLLDSNSNEIFEGDICLYQLKSDNQIVEQDFGPVEFIRGAFVLNPKDKDIVYLADYIFDGNITELQVVGNIFERE